MTPFLLSRVDLAVRRWVGSATAVTIAAEMRDAHRSPDATERWSLDAGDAATATLTIPADARRERLFEIACAMTVAVPAEGDPSTAWHQLTLLVDGEQQWCRREPSHNAGAWDGLDYRFRRTVAVGRALRISVAVAVHGVRRRSLVIEADEA